MHRTLPSDANVNATDLGMLIILHFVLSGLCIYSESGRKARSQKVLTWLIDWCCVLIVLIGVADAVICEGIADVARCRQEWSQWSDCQCQYRRLAHSCTVAHCILHSKPPLASATLVDISWGPVCTLSPSCRSSIWRAGLRPKWLSSFTKPSSSPTSNNSRPLWWDVLLGVLQGARILPATHKPVNTSLQKKRFCLMMNTKHLPAKVKIRGLCQMFTNTQNTSLQKLRSEDFAKWWQTHNTVNTSFECGCCCCCWASHVNCSTKSLKTLEPLA